MNKVETEKFEKYISWLAREMNNSSRQVKRAAKEGDKDNEQYLRGYEKGILEAGKVLVELGLWKE